MKNSRKIKSIIKETLGEMGKPRTSAKMPLNQVKKLVWDGYTKYLYNHYDEPDGNLTQDDDYDNARYDIRGARSLDELIQVLDGFGMDEPLQFILDCIVESPKSKSRFKV